MVSKMTRFLKFFLHIHKYLYLDISLSITVKITKYYNFLEKAFKFVFTTLDGKEETGPASTSGYAGTSLDGKVTLSNGIQIWSVPVTGRYIIEAFGASGANDTYSNQSEWRIGGLGAKMEGTFTFAKGAKFKILIGQEGHRSADFSDRPGGGGGGTFVTLLDDTPLIIAGGGGGGGTPIKQFGDGEPGQVTENGTRCGGTGGNGGQPCNADTGSVDFAIPAGGGAGLKGNGGGGSGGLITSSLSFINGGTGGICPTSKGGFGGGSCGFVAGGGGGGYSGGGVVGSSSSGVAGGGGSYNIGTNQQNKAGVNKGDGKVIITLKN